MSFVVAVAVRRAARIMSAQSKCGVMASFNPLFTGRIEACSYLWCIAGNPARTGRVERELQITWMLHR